MLAPGDKVKVTLIHDFKKSYNCEVVSLPDVRKYPYWEFKIKMEWMDDQGAHMLWNLFTVSIHAVYSIDKTMNGGYG